MTKTLQFAESDYSIVKDENLKESNKNKVLCVNYNLKMVTCGIHSDRASPPAGLVLLEGPIDNGGCQSGGLTLI